MTACPPTQRRQSGVTLLEMMLVIFAMGLVLAANMVGRKADTQRNAVNEAVFMDAVVSALFNYARRNHRLPCPDLDGDGLEDASNGVCNSAATKAGGVPFSTLEMSGLGPIDNGIGRQFVYGVYRGGGDVTRDLTRDAERTVPPHAPPHVSYRNLDDFKQALINARTVTQTVDPSEIFVTGNDANSGSSNCALNRVANMAFVVAYAGAKNADTEGGNFDGVHLSSASWDSVNKWTGVAANTCFVGPGKPMTPSYDDVVKAVSFVELIGVLSQ